MKLLISLVTLFSIAAFAADPADVTPNSAEKEKVSDTQNTGGALKVEKTPAKVEGLNTSKKHSHHVSGKKHHKQKHQKK